MRELKNPRARGPSAIPVSDSDDDGTDEQGPTAMGKNNTAVRLTMFGDGMAEEESRIRRARLEYERLGRLLECFYRVGQPPLGPAPSRDALRAPLQGWLAGQRVGFAPPGTNQRPPERWSLRGL